MMPKVAVILADGLGMQLRSVVSDMPKPLVPIHEQQFWMKS